jgi:hypothetical protein
MVMLSLKPVLIQAAVAPLPDASWGHPKGQRDEQGTSPSGSITTQRVAKALIRKPVSGIVTPFQKRQPLFWVLPKRMMTPSELPQASCRCGT